MFTTMVKRTLAISLLALSSPFATAGIITLTTDGTVTPGAACGAGCQTYSVDATVVAINTDDGFVSNWSWSIGSLQIAANPGTGSWSATSTLGDSLFGDLSVAITGTTWDISLAVLGGDGVFAAQQGAGTAAFAQIAAQSAQQPLAFTGGTGSLSLNSVPEPSTIALLAIGLAGVAFTRKRRLSLAA